MEYVEASELEAAAFIEAHFVESSGNAVWAEEQLLSLPRVERASSSYHRILICACCVPWFVLVFCVRTCGCC